MVFSKTDAALRGKAAAILDMVGSGFHPSQIARAIGVRTFFVTRTLHRIGLGSMAGAGGRYDFSTDLAKILLRWQSSHRRLYKAKLEAAKLPPGESGRPFGLEVLPRLEQADSEIDRHHLALLDRLGFLKPPKGGGGVDDELLARLRQLPNRDAIDAEYRTQRKLLAEDLGEPEALGVADPNKKPGR